MNWRGSVFGPQFVQGGDSGNHRVVFVDRLVGLGVRMTIYCDTRREGDGSSDDQADGAAKTKRRDLHFACRKKVERIGPADGFGLRR